MMNTKIKWERTDQVLSRDSEERSIYYLMEGRDNRGNMYSAVGLFVCGELESIDEIELEKEVPDEPPHYWNGYEYIKND